MYCPRYLPTKFNWMCVLTTPCLCVYSQVSSVRCVCLTCHRQPVHARWAFTLDRGAKLREKWKLIPQEVDILVTHGPPLGYGDRVSGGERAGCLDLLDEVKHRIKPKYHIYGHIHEGERCAVDTYMKVGGVLWTHT